MLLQCTKAQPIYSKLSYWFTVSLSSFCKSAADYAAFLSCLFGPIHYSDAFLQSERAGIFWSSTSTVYIYAFRQYNFMLSVSLASVATFSLEEAKTRLILGRLTCLPVCVSSGSKYHRPLNHKLPSGSCQMASILVSEKAPENSFCLAMPGLADAAGALAPEAQL